MASEDAPGFAALPTEDSGGGKARRETTLSGCLTGCCLLEDDNLPSLLVVVVVVRALSFISALSLSRLCRHFACPALVRPTELARARMARKEGKSGDKFSFSPRRSLRQTRERGGRPLPVPSVLPCFPTSSYPLPTSRRGGRPKKRLEGRRDFSRVAAAVAALNCKYLTA